MIIAHPNARNLSQAYEALGRVDVGGLSRRHLQSNAVLHRLGVGRLAGDYHGAAIIAVHLRDLLEETRGTLAFEPFAILADDDYAVALINTQGRRRGHSLADREVHVARMRDGRIAEWWLYSSDSPTIVQAWS